MATKVAANMSSYRCNDLNAEDDHKQYDNERSPYLAKQGVFVVRFWNNEVLQNIEGVWQKINEELAIRSNPPQLSLNLR